MKNRKPSVTWLNQRCLHIEAAGCIVNVTPGLTDSEGQEVTSIEIICEPSYAGETADWKLVDLPAQPKGTNIRVVNTGRATR